MTIRTCPVFSRCPDSTTDEARKYLIRHPADQRTQSGVRYIRRSTMDKVRELLEQQVRDWERRGFFGVAVAEELLADVRGRYGSDPDEPRSEPRLTIGILILLSLGTVALAAAVGVWFAREWGEWSHPFRITLALAVPAMFAAAGYYLQRPAEKSFPALGRVAYTLAAVATLSVTALLAAMYDLHPRHAFMTFIQAGVFLTLAVLIDSALLLWVGLLALGMAFGFEVTSSWGGWLSLQRPIPFVGFGLLVLCAGLLVRSHHRRLGGHIVIFGSLTAFLALFVIALEDSSFPHTGQTTLQMWITLFLPFVIALGVIGYDWAKRRIRYGRGCISPVCVEGRTLGAWLGGRRGNIGPACARQRSLARRPG